jgi:Spy/CpxP family protein refolding chaperone
MKKLLLSTLLAASSTLVLAGTAQAAPTATANATSTTTIKQVDQAQMMHKKGAFKNKGHNPMAALNLTEAQQAKIKAIMQEQRGNSDRTQMRAEHQQTQQKIAELTKASTLDTRALNTMADAQAAKAKQRFIKRVQMQHAIAQVLTPEQREQMATARAERQSQGGQGWKRGQK